MVPTISIEPETKDRLDEHRWASHEDREAVINSMMEVVPSREDIKAGCARCGLSPWGDGPVDEIGGVVDWFTDENGETISTWYCSRDCLIREHKEVDDVGTDHPDLVVVGGNEMPRARMASGTHYRYDSVSEEVLIDVPGAFTGRDVGRRYDYHGEPVYLKNNGVWFASGVIDNILHADGRTHLLLERDPETERENHPINRLVARTRAQGTA